MVEREERDIESEGTGEEEIFVEEIVGREQIEETDEEIGKEEERGKSDGCVHEMW